jgi:hypothetical protein
MTVAGGLEIRPGSDADLPALVVVLGQQRWVSDQLARQRAGGGVLLVAWLEDQPAGDVYLSLEPDPNQAVRRHLPGCRRSSTWRSWRRTSGAASAPP